MIYINRKDSQTGQRETVSEPPNRKEANAELVEYKISDNQGEYYISSRPCQNWKE